MRLLTPALILASLGLASAASSRIVEIVPEPPPPALGQWSLEDPFIATARQHPLAPAVRIDSGSPLMEVTIGGGTLRMIPLGINAATFQAPRTRRAGIERVPVTGFIAPGQPRIDLTYGMDDGDPVRELVVANAWQDVDERFVLTRFGVKHDLLLSADAVTRLGLGDVVANWLVDLPPGLRLLPSGQEARFGYDVVDAAGAVLANIPAPIVRDGAGGHGVAGVARLELLPRPGAPLLRLVVPGAWVNDPARVFPLALDPTVNLQPTDVIKTGFVNEFGMRDTDEILSGSAFDAGFGRDCRGYAEFPIGGIPDGANILDVHLKVWLNNHDNPFNPAVPLPMWIKFCPVEASSPPSVIFAAVRGLGNGRVYHNEMLPRTGSEFCVSSYVLRDFDLGPLADADVRAQLPADFYTIGFTSDIVDDPDFDHIDYQGYNEFVPGSSCPPDFPGSRITLIVEYEEPNQPPVCDAGGPYTSDCPGEPIVVSAAASFDPDGDPLTYAWTSDCSGTIENPDQVDAILHLDPGCVEACTCTVTVSDGLESRSCSAAVLAQDVTPPDFAGGDAFFTSIWPPNHGYVVFETGNMVETPTDRCSLVSVRAIGCSSSQPEEVHQGRTGDGGNGDGRTFEDCVVSVDGSQFAVRSERLGACGADSRREYRLALAIEDACGNVAPATVGVITVEHDRSGHEVVLRGHHLGPNDPPPFPYVHSTTYGTGCQ